MKIRNTFIIFIVSGFWHGANWTFIVWGALNAVYFLPLLLTNKNRNHMETVAQGKLIPGLKEFLSMVLTFGLTVFAWIFFRAESLGHAISYISGIFSSSLFSIPHFKDATMLTPTLLLGLFFIVIEWLGRENQYAIQNLLTKNRIARWSFYYLILLLIFIFAGSSQEFIYFQF